MQSYSQVQEFVLHCAQNVKTFVKVISLTVYNNASSPMRLKFHGKPTVVQTFHLKPQMSTSCWHQRKKSWNHQSH